MKHPSSSVRRWLTALLIILFFPVLPCASVAADGNTLVFPKDLKVIRAEAFRGDDFIQKAVLPDGILKIYTRAFADSSLREINLPESLTYISEDAFDNSCLQTVTAPKGSYAYNWARTHGYIAECRALLIGEKTFLRSVWEVDEYGNEKEKFYKQLASRNANDVTKMAAMLDKVYGPPESMYQTTMKINASYDMIQSLIQTTFADTMEQDISLFFIASHGYSDGDGELEMAFTGNPDSEEDRETYGAKRWLPFDVLAEWLSEMVQGKVIVILESCGAGSSIYVENGAKGNRGSEEDRSEDIVQAAVKAFAKADPGVAQEPDGDLRKNSTGDLRKPKFYVLAAARHKEPSWGYGNQVEDPMNLFTKWLIQGVGTKDFSPADTDIADNKLTLNELYQYIREVEYKQHVQVYPENSDQVVFLFK